MWVKNSYSVDDQAPEYALFERMNSFRRMFQLWPQSVTFDFIVLVDTLCQKLRNSGHAKYTVRLEAFASVHSTEPSRRRNDQINTVWSSLAGVNDSEQQHFTRLVRPMSINWGDNRNSPNVKAACDEHGRETDSQRRRRHRREILIFLSAEIILTI